MKLFNGSVYIYNSIKVEVLMSIPVLASNSTQQWKHVEHPFYKMLSLNDEANIFFHSFEKS